MNNFSRIRSLGAATLIFQMAARAAALEQPATEPQANSDAITDEASAQTDGAAPEPRGVPEPQSRQVRRAMARAEAKAYRRAYR